MTDERTVELPLDVVRKLFALWEAWENADCYDPDGEPGIGTMVGTESVTAMDEAHYALEPHAAHLRELLGIPPPEPKVPTLVFDGLHVVNIPYGETS